MSLLYRRHPLVLIGFVLMILAILARWILPRVTNIPENAIHLTATVVQGISIACGVFGIILGGRRAEQEQSPPS